MLYGRYQSYLLHFKGWCVSLALADSQGNFFINGGFRRDPAGNYNIAGTTFTYRVNGPGGYAKESLDSKGPINRELILFVRALEMIPWGFSWHLFVT